MDNSQINALKVLLNDAISQCNEIAAEVDTSEGGMGHMAMLAARGRVDELVQQLNVLGVIVAVTARDPYTLQVSYTPSLIH